MNLIVTLLALLHAPATAGTVTVDPSTLAAWTAATEEADPRFAPQAADREVRLTLHPDRVDVVVRWTVAVDRPTWFVQTLAGLELQLEQITVDGRPAKAWTAPGGLVLAQRLDRPAVVELRGVLAGEPTVQAIRANLLPAATGRILVEVAEEVGDGWVPSVLGGGTRPVVGLPDARGRRTWVGSSGQIVVRLERERPPGPVRPVVLATAGVGLTVDDAVIRGQARVTWTPRQGSLRRLRVQVQGVGADLDVRGAGIRGWQRRGQVVEIDLGDERRSAVSLTLTWSTKVPSGATAALPTPVVRPLDVVRAEAATVVATAGEVEVAPDLSGWRAVATRRVPEWAAGLVDAAPLAAFVRPAGPTDGRLQLLRFVPAEQPPIVVDVADLEVVASSEGRWLGLARWTVRNERGGALQVRLPAGAVPLAVVVDGVPESPARLADGRWHVPIPRSVETVDGLLSFPVHLVWRLDGPAWQKDEERTVPVPAVDAPVAVSRSMVRLPPGWRHTGEVGERRVVESFDEGEGLAYGFGVGGAAEEEAESLYEEAVDAWMRNDFSTAQDALDDLRAIGASNSNLDRLQSNLDVVEGRRGGEDAKARRIKEQARARGLELYRAQEELVREAEEALARGERDKARAAYGLASAAGKDLAKLDDAASVEQQAQRSTIAGELRQLEAQERLEDRVAASSAAAARMDGVAAPVVVEELTEAAEPADDAVLLDDLEASAVSAEALESLDLEDDEMVSEYASRLRSSQGAAKAKKEADRAARRERVKALQAPAPPPAAEVGAVTLDEVATVQSVASRQTPGLLGGLKVLGAGRGSAPRSRVKRATPAPNTPSSAPAAPEPSPLTAASAVVRLPALGEAVRFQQLLVPEGDAPELRVIASPPPRLASRSRR